MKSDRLASTSQKSVQRYTIVAMSFSCGVGAALAIQLVTGMGQDVPGTGGLTRYQVAEMLYECDRGEHEGYCVADVNIHPHHEKMAIAGDSAE